MSLSTVDIKRVNCASASAVRRHGICGSKRGPCGPLGNESGLRRRTCREELRCPCGKHSAIFPGFYKHDEHGDANNETESQNNVAYKLVRNQSYQLLYL